MAHVAKYKRGATGHLAKHYERGRDDAGNYIKFGNEDIDPERTPQNYNLAPDRGDQVDFIRQRCSEVQCSKRADVNVMCSWVVTRPPHLFEGEERAFFEETYSFLSEKYGEKNVISAYVHMDETTPHMHFSFIPVAIDKKKGIEKVSAKEVLTKTELQSFHRQLDERMQERFHRDIGVVNEVTKDGNKEIAELKRETALEKVAQAEKQALEAQGKAKAMLSSLAPIKAEYDAKKAYVRACDKASDVSVALPDYAKVKKNLITGQETVTVPIEKWQEKHISANEKSYLASATKEFEKTITNFHRTTSAKYIRQLEQKTGELEKQVHSLTWENRQLQSKLQGHDREADKLLERVKRVLKKLPEEIETKFVTEWNKDKERSQGRSR